MSYGLKLHFINILNHMACLLGIFLIWNGSLSASWLWISFFFYLLYGLLGANIGLHRYLSHRSFETSVFWDFVLKAMTVPVCFGSPLAWSALHRYHHVHSDTDKDIQDPQRIGFFRSWFAMYPKMTVDVRLVRDLIQQKDIRFLHRHYFMILGGFAMFLALLHPVFPIFALSIPAVLCFHGVAAIGVIPHYSWAGYRSIETNDRSVNSPLASLLSLGEGWHNNHHAHPSRYDHGQRWWEIDPSQWVIRIIRRR